MAEKYYGVSPYAYCAGDPVNRVDPDGRTDYFGFIGDFLYNDDNEDGEIRIINNSIFDKLYDKKDPEDLLSLSFHQNLFDASKTFTGALREEPMFSRNAALKVINYFTENEVIEGKLKVPNEQHKSGSFGTRYNAPIMVDFDVLMHDGKRNHKVIGTDLIYYTYIYDNSYNIQSAVDDHEWFHQNDPLMEGDREARAYAYQAKSARFSKCTPEYRKIINNRLIGNNR